MADKKPVEYVNNADLLAAIIKYRKQCAEAEACGDPKPQINNYIGECILKLSLIHI